MKKLTLTWNVYKKFFEISDRLSLELDNDVSLINISTNLIKLSELIRQNAWDDLLEGELLWRWMHYIVLDNIDIIWSYLDDSKEVAYLKTTFVWVFEILELSKNKVVYLDISTWEKYDIVWEWELSESSLEEDFSVWDLIISRLIKLDDGWYNMKNYYYIQNNWSLENYFEELKLAYKHIFSWVKDVLDVEERMNLLTKNLNWDKGIWANINYLKRIKWILLKPMWKKNYRKLENILKSNKKNSYTDFLNFLKNYKLSQKEIEDLKEYASAYLQENIKSPLDEKKEQLNIRIKMVMETFFQVLLKENIEIPNDRKMTEKEFKNLEDRKNKWFEEKNSLFWDRTPKEFLHDIDPEYDINDLRFQQIDPEEEEFYDWYNKYFTDEEKEIYEKALKDSKSKNFKSAINWYIKLLDEHGNFFRLKWNYISSFVNSIIDKYWKVKDDSFVKTIELEELEKDFDFMTNLSKELKNLDKLKKWYSINWSNNFDYIMKHFIPLLSHLVLIKRYEIIKELIKNDNEEELVNKVKIIIPDFEVEEFIEKVREENTTYIDYKSRIIKNLWYKEDDMWDIFPYFWKKYKNKSDFINDDIEKLYKNIWVRKIKLEWLNKFNQFILENSKQIKSRKSKIRIIIKESIEFWDIIMPNLILNMIDNEEERKKFIFSMGILGIKL
jgi:hypothetical protein